jgi:DUF1365 family protein
MATEIELDVERVNAVHAKLAGPLKVWCLSWDELDDIGRGFRLYATREAALLALPSLAASDFAFDDLHSLNEAALDAEDEAHSEAVGANAAMTRMVDELRGGAVSTKNERYEYELLQEVVHS